MTTEEIDYVLGPLELVVMRMNQAIEALPPFSDARKQLVEERLALRDSAARVRRVLGGVSRTVLDAA